MKRIRDEIIDCIETRFIQHFFIQAPWGYGKTALLYYLKNELSAMKSCNTLFIDGNSIYSEEDFYLTLIKSYKRDKDFNKAFTDPEIARELCNKDETLLNLFDSYYTKLFTKPKKHIFYDEIIRFLSIDSTGKKNILIILIDDFDILLNNRNINEETFSNRLRKYLHEYPSNFMLIVTARKIPDSLKTPSAPFLRFFRVERLPKLNRRELTEFFTEELKKLDIGSLSTQKIIDSILGKTGGNPYYTKVLLRSLYSNLYKKDIVDITESDVEEAYEDMCELLQPVLPRILPSSAQEVKILKALTNYPSISDIEGVTNIKTQNIRALISNLKKNGYIYNVDKGEYALSDPILENWLKTSYEMSIGW